MTGDDYIYAFLLLLSLVFGGFVKSTPTRRRFLPPLLGILMVSLSAGTAIWHSIVTTLGFILLLSMCPLNFLHYFTCIWCFGYLGFFRLCHHFEFAKTGGITNAVQLLITLRLIGLSFELHDSFATDVKLADSAPYSDHSHLKLVKIYKNVHVSALDVILYVYSYIGIFTGPYYKYRTFYDFIHHSPGAPRASSNQLIQQLQEVPLFGVAYFILSHFYTVDYARTDEFHARHLAYRVLFMMIIFFIFRLRIYFAWKMAECICVAAGLGAYPTVSEPVSGEGPTNLNELDRWIARYDSRSSSSQPTTLPDGSLCSATADTDQYESEVYDYSTVQNISVWNCEFSPTVREGMRAWNQTVQYWLATNFHKRCIGPRTFRYMYTMLVSAYWHGFHPGYYLSFLTVPLALMAESGLAVVVSACGSALPNGSLPFLSWLLKMRVFEYCAMGFLLLDAEATLAYWRSIGYFVHVLLIAIVLLSAVIQRFTTKSPRGLSSLVS